MTPFSYSNRLRPSSVLRHLLGGVSDRLEARYREHRQQRDGERDGEPALHRGSAYPAFGRTSKNGVPRNAVLASVAFGFVTVGLNYAYPEKVLPLLLNAVGSTILVLWTFVAVSHMVLRRRARRNGTEDTLPLKMWGFPYLSYATLGLLAGIVVLALFDSAARTQLLATGALTAAIAGACTVLHRRRTKR